MKTNVLKAACFVLVIMVWLPPALVWSAHPMHSGMGVKPHPLATPFHGASIGEERVMGIGPPQTVTIDASVNGVPFLAESPINLIPMLGFGVGLILLIVLGALQRQGRGV